MFIRTQNQPNITNQVFLFVTLCTIELLAVWMANSFYGYKKFSCNKKNVYILMNVIFPFFALKREKGTKIGERLIWAFLSSNWLMPWLFHWIKQFQIKILDQLTIWDWKTDAVICKEFERNSIKQHKICVSSFYITYQVILAIRTIKIDSFEK